MKLEHLVPTEKAKEEGSYQKIASDHDNELDVIDCQKFWKSLDDVTIKGKAPCRDVDHMMIEGTAPCRNTGLRNRCYHAIH